MPGPTSANVHSLDAIKDVRAALIKFQERSINALGDLRQKIDRTLAWIEQDRPNYWREQERRAYDLVASTRVAFETCRLRTVGGRRSDCIEEKKDFEKAKRRLEYVHEKQRLVQKWMVQSAQEVNEYRSRTSTFQRTLDNDVPLMIAQLGRMIDAIEAYSEVSSSGPELVSSEQSVNQTATTDSAAESESNADLGNAKAVDVQSSDASTVDPRMDRDEQ